MEIAILVVMAAILVSQGFQARRLERLRVDLVAWRASEAAAIARAQERAERREARRGQVTVRERIAVRTGG